MLPAHIDRIRTHYLGVINRMPNRKTLSFDQKIALLRKYLFMDLLELENYDLMQQPEWRQAWATSEELPEGVDSATTDRVWKLVDEAIAPVYEVKPTIPA